MYLKKVISQKNQKKNFFIGKTFNGLLSYWIIGSSINF